MKPKQVCRIVQYRPSKTKTKSVAQLRAKIRRVSWNIFVSILQGMRQNSIPHLPTLLVFDTHKHTKWKCLRSLTQVYTKIHGFANNMAALSGVRFATDAEARTAVQKALWAIPAK